MKIGFGISLAYIQLIEKTKIKKRHLSTAYKYTETVVLSMAARLRVDSTRRRPSRIFEFILSIFVTKRHLVLVWVL